MPMPQYNGPTYGYNPYQTYPPQSPWQGPQPNPNGYYGCQQNCYQSCGC